MQWLLDYFAVTWVIDMAFSGMTQKVDNNGHNIFLGFFIKEMTWS